MDPSIVAIPEPLCEFVRRRAAASGYASPDMYVESLIWTDKRFSRQRLEGQLLEGLESGPATEMTYVFSGSRSHFPVGSAIAPPFSGRESKRSAIADPTFSLRNPLNTYEMTVEDWDEMRRKFDERHSDVSPK